MAESSACGSNFREAMLVALSDHLFHLFLPLLHAACWNILWRMMGQWGLPTSHPAYPSKNISTSMWHSISLTDRPSVLTHSLVARDLLCLSPCHNSSNLWCLKKTRKHYSTWNYIIQPKQHNNTKLRPSMRLGHLQEVQLYTFSTSQQSTEMYHISSQDSSWTTCWPTLPCFESWLLLSSSLQIFFFYCS